MRQCDGLRGAEHISRRKAALEQAACAACGDNSGLCCKGHDVLIGPVVEHGADNLSACILKKVDKLVAGEQANAERLDLGRARVF